MRQTITCDIVIPVLDQLAITRRCVEALFTRTVVSYRLILIDNGSSEVTRSYLEEIKDTHDNVMLIRNNENKGWVKAVNQGLAASTSGHVCIMNNDAIVMTERWLSKLITIAGMRADIGLVNPAFEIKNKSEFKDPFIEIDFCRGYCVLIKRSVIEKIGVLDEAYGIGYYDDDDFSVRAIHAGFCCVRARDVFVEHLKDSTFLALFEPKKRQMLHRKNELIFYSKWGRRLRLLFIVNGQKSRKDKFCDILFSLARNQHLVYLWNARERFNCKHINIREKKLYSYTPAVIFLLKLFSNRLKKKAKRYDAIFVEKKSEQKLLSRLDDRVHRFDMSNKGQDLFFLIERLTENTKKESAASLEVLIR